MILTLKLILSPLLIAGVSLAGRKWGESVSGWFLGFPLTSLPISLVLALQQGTDFAAASAAGNLGGQASVCVFCLVYGISTLRSKWPVSAIAGLTAFFVSVAVLNQFRLTAVSAFIVILSIVAVTFTLLPRSGGEVKTTVLPTWDLPLRMALAAAFVFGLTLVADRLGPQLSGLLATFPVFGLIMSIFTHQQGGSTAALKLFRSYISASAGYAFFYLIVGTLLTRLGIGLTFILATLVIFAINGLTLFILQKKEHPAAG